MIDRDERMSSKSEAAEPMLDPTRNSDMQFVTIMVAELKNLSTASEAESGDANHPQITTQQDWIVPVLEHHAGVFVKCVDNSIWSYFADAQNAVRAAVQIQQCLDQFNLARQFNTTVLMRIGLHSGECCIGKHDISGDAVDTASRYKSLANPGEIVISEDTYQGLSDKSEMCCRFIKLEMQKNMKESCNAYKIFWNSQEFEHDKVESNSSDPVSLGKPTSKIKLMLIVLIPMLLVLALTLRDKIGDSIQPAIESRSISHSIKKTE